MGWKAAAIFIRAGQPVGIAPMEHDPTRIAPLFAAIALPAHPTGQNETLRTAIDPRRKANYIGCYNNLTVITSWACAEAQRHKPLGHRPGRERSTDPNRRRFGG